MIIDSHCHLHDPAFADVRGSRLRARPSTTSGASSRSAAIAPTNERTLGRRRRNAKAVWPALGFHPELASSTRDDLEAVEAQVHAQSLAPGRARRDRAAVVLASRAPPTPPRCMTRGRARLERLLELAARYDLPVVLHAPHGAAVDALRGAQAPRGRARGVPLAQGAGRGDPRASSRRATWCRSRPRWCTASAIASWSRRCRSSRCSSRATRPWPYQGEFDGRRLRALARRAGGRGGGEDQAAARSTRRCTSSPSTPAALFDLDSR